MISENDFQNDLKIQFFTVKSSQSRKSRFNEMASQKELPCSGGPGYGKTFSGWQTLGIKDLLQNIPIRSQYFDWWPTGRPTPAPQT